MIFVLLRLQFGNGMKCPLTRGGMTTKRMPRSASCMRFANCLLIHTEFMIILYIKDSLLVDDHESRLYTKDHRAPQKNKGGSHL